MEEVNIYKIQIDDLHDMSVKNIVTTQTSTKVIFLIKLFLSQVISIQMLHNVQLYKKNEMSLKITNKIKYILEWLHVKRMRELALTFPQMRLCINDLFEPRLPLN